MSLFWGVAGKAWTTIIRRDDARRVEIHEQALTVESERVFGSRGRRHAAGGAMPQSALFTRGSPAQAPAPASGGYPSQS